MPARKKPLLDTSTPAGKRMQKRLEKELIIWLATCGADGRPHAVPVWFLWDGKTFLIYSVPGQKVKDIEANPLVQLHFNTTPDGGDVVRTRGRRVAPEALPARIQSAQVHPQVRAPDQEQRMEA